MQNARLDRSFTKTLRHICFFTKLCEMLKAVTEQLCTFRSKDSAVRNRLCRKAGAIIRARAKTSATPNNCSLKRCSKNILFLL